MPMPIKLVVLSLFFMHSAFSNELKIVTEEYPPYNFTSSNTIIKGISSDIVLEMAKRANINIKISLYPWARAMKMAISQGNTCLISTIRTKEREDKFKWIGPIISDHLALFALDNNTQIIITSIKDAKKYSIGTYNNSATIPILEKYGMKYETSPEDKLNPRMLKSKRIDLWIANSKTGLFIANKEGIKVRVVFTFNESTDMYLACNKGMSDQTVNTYNKILRDLANDGILKKIEKKYSQNIL